MTVQRKVTYRAELAGGAQVKAEFQGIGQAGKEAHEKVDRASKSAEKSAQVFKRTLDAEERAFRSLKASIDPAYAAQMRMAQAEARLDRAVKLGIVSKRDAGQMLKQMEVRAKSTAAAMEVMDGAIVRSSGGLKQVLMQLSQVAQQGSVTGNYIAAASLQAADIGLAFGPAGIAIGSLIAVMGPMLAGMGKAKAEAKNLGAELQGAYDSAKTALEEAATSQERYANAILLSKTHQDIVTPSILRSLSLEANARAALARVEEAKMERQKQELKTALAANEAALQAAMETATVAASVGAFNITATDEQKAARVAAFIRAAREENSALILTIQEQQAELDLVNSLLAQGNGEAAKTVDELLAAVDAGRDLSTTDVGAGIRSGVSEAAALAANLNISLALAKRIAALGPQGTSTRDSNGKVYSGRSGDPRSQGGSAFDWSVRDADAWLAAWKSPKIERPKKAGGGGVSKEARAAQQEANRLQQEAQRMYDSTRTALEKLNAETARAEELLVKGLITQDTHARYVKQQEDAYRKAADAQREMMGIAQPVKDTMINSLMGQKSAADQLATALKRAAIEYALFGTGGFARKDSKFGGLLGGVFGKLFSFDGGGYTGDGPRSGGLDGKGGMLAVVHPRETVIDHTRAPSSGNRRSESDPLIPYVAIGDGVQMSWLRQSQLASGSQLARASRARDRNFGARADEFQMRGGA